MNPSVAIVILNYNGQHYLEKFLPKVIEHSGNHAIWIADNASTDQSLDWLKTHYPGLNTLVISENKGYAGGYNDALRRIQADYYILLNSDIEVTENWIAPVIAFMESDPLIAACQPKIRAYDLPTHFEYAGAAGGYMDYLGYPFCRGRIFDTREEDLGQYDDEKDVFWATGACLFVRSSAFHAASGFDESFFAHMEEIDLCWRLLNMRYRITYCGKSTVYHVGGGTLHKSNPKKTFLNYRNNLIMLYKNLPKGRRWKTVLIRLILDGISSVRFMATGAWPDVLAIVRAHFAFYAMIPELTRKTQRTRYRAPLYYRSVVWEYFVLGKHKFEQLTGIEPIKAPRL
ncbi:MAG: dTDP-Rha--alpha-D-GlcNAc-pyrophosphate polyprenol alpha-3-L-rhamnosyltransferase [Dyadobacter sp. 50-39]|uniref:glycosyltransferase family 2 protein n=1 Tax=Dyadobacter sp. 50-39 TaxID=1895756 RepID=UPI000968F065|nr:glycosyltransferase family 2 protein [Dyadobacter sp. 50-39]OJV13766.1 MAG: dTDP-Rha--alpha-D-GlcNAc-pyrophosphate polyprenol alpha-3-L-rhamnosyltransferase [Dyadobacter sp. 50-39]